MITTDELRAEFQKQTGTAPVFANRLPYITYIEWLEGQLKQVKNLAIPCVTTSYLYFVEYKYYRGSGLYGTEKKIVEFTDSKEVTIDNIKERVSGRKHSDTIIISITKI